MQANDMGRRGLVIATSDAAIGGAFARAADRALACARANRLPSGEAAGPALAAVVLGDAGPAAALLDAWAAGELETRIVDPTSELVSLSLLAARQLAWTGDAALARRLWPRVSELRERAKQLATTPGTDPARAAVIGGLLRELSPLADVAGDRPAAAAMEADARAILRSVRTAAPAPASREYLVAAALSGFDPDPPPGFSDAIAALDPGPPPVVSAADPGGEPYKSLSDFMFRCLVAWAALTSGRTEFAERWGRLITWLDREAAKPNAISAEPTDITGEAAAIAILGGAFGLIGAAPDAPKGRLRLRPHLPTDWELLEVRDLAVADARFDLRVRRENGRRSYTVEQTAGAVPATVILEMVVPGPSVRSVEVDGRSAALDVRAFGPAHLVPVQLVADDVRAVTLEGEGL